MCPTCGAMIDEDFDVEHYEVCQAELEEWEKEHENSVKKES